MNIFIFSLLFFLFSCILTWCVRAYSLHKAILDIPNERSSHVVPTPRGGGVAIALAFFTGVSGLTWYSLISLALAKALLGGGICIAATGYWDDLKSLPASIRGLLHFLAAGWAVYCLGGFSVLTFGEWQFHLGWLGAILATVGIVWLINLYNFMDGIDGLAGSEAVFVSLVSGISLYLMGGVGLAAVCFFLAAAVMGFLIWNWPPAKIFLGDVGSGLLGFIFAVLALASAKQNYLPLASWLVLLAVFVFDATFTLLHRMARGERWYAAHRDHVYQRMVQRGMSHKAVTLGVMAINLGVLLPVFYFMLRWQNLSPWFFVLIIILSLTTWMRVVLANKINANSQIKSPCN